MLDAKEASNLMSPNQVPTLIDGTSVTNETEYRSVVSTLQYLSMTRPDIAFTVEKLAQFMNSPTSGHWSAIKRLLRYLHGTIHHGLFFQKGTPLALHAYSNANWARKP